jgi:hypothetical protein
MAGSNGLSSDHPELAAFAAAFERRGRVAVLETLVRVLRQDPRADFLTLIETMLVAEQSNTVVVLHAGPANGHLVE